MQRTTHRVVILSGNTVYAHAVKGLLAEGCNSIPCHIVTEQDLEGGHRTPGEDLLLLHAEQWEEMEAWRYLLHGVFAECPRLVVVDLRIPGLYLSELQSPLCTLLPSSASSAALKETFSLLMEYRAQAAFDILRNRLIQRASSSAEIEQLAHVHVREIECACGLALGLSHRRIGSILSISPETVRTHTNTLANRLGLHHRDEVADYVRSACQTIKFVEQNPRIRLPGS